MYHAPSPAGSRTPMEQQTHKHPRRPRLVIAMCCLFYGLRGVTTLLGPKGGGGQISLGSLFWVSPAFGFCLATPPLLRNKYRDSLFLFWHEASRVCHCQGFILGMAIDAGDGVGGMPSGPMFPKAVGRHGGSGGPHHHHHPHPRHCELWARLHHHDRHGHPDTASPAPPHTTPSTIDGKASCELEIRPSAQNKSTKNSALHRPPLPPPEIIFTQWGHQYNILSG